MREIIAGTAAFFDAKDESSHKSGIEMLERRLNECVVLYENYVDEN